MNRTLWSLLSPIALWSATAVAQTAPDQRADTPTVAPGVTDRASDERSRVQAEQARDLGREGLRAYGESNFELALDRFTRAEQLAHSPVFQLYRARCLRELGRRDEAKVLLEEIATTALAEDTPEAWQRARQAAEVELAALAEPSGPKPAEPAHLPGGFDADGRTRAEVSGQPRLPSWHPASPVAPGFWQQRTANERGALASFGIGTIALVFTGVTGGLAMAEAAAVRANCLGTSCRPEDLPRAQHAEQLANLATAGGIATLAAVATGTVLWLLPTADRAVAVRPHGAGLALVGRF